MISIDFIVELPESHGYDTIMCVVDSLTKRAHFIPMHTTINAKGTALLFLQEVWKHHGTPREVVSDRGPQFITRFMRKLYKLLGIKLAMSIAYHPQTNGQMEHVDTPLAPSPHVDRSRLHRSNVYRSSTQNADATILRTCKVDDISLSILIIATLGDLGLSRL
jgi:transposase InsO family protein